MNYYNEWDKPTAAWLQELINQRLIPDGHVDTRSICDVQPGDLDGYTQCHFFAGIGGWPLALQLAGWPPDRPVWTASFPCQPVSVAGKNLARMMKDGCCKKALGLSKHVNQLVFLESKSPAWNGWMPRIMQWQVRTTPLGLRFAEQIPLEPFKNVDGCIGQLLPTPTASDNRNRGSINKTPSVTRRMNSGKQIGLSMLFDGKPCPFCVAGMMGYPQEWVRCAVKALETR